MIRSWDEIRGHYADLADRDPRLGAMKALVDQIEVSPTLSRLYAWTSMLDLNIVQTPVTYPYDGPRLVVSPTSDGAIDFRYVDTPIESKQWRRTVSGAEAFGRLQHFTEQLRWFVRPR
jgi:hypothetical protein